MQSKCQGILVIAGIIMAYFVGLDGYLSSQRANFAYAEPIPDSVETSSDELYCQAEIWGVGCH